MYTLEYKGRTTPATAQYAGTTEAGKHAIILGGTYMMFATVDELVELAADIINCITAIQEAELLANETAPQ
jgi:hypothetical protein